MDELQLVIEELRNVTDVTDDSRKVQSGGAFIAVSGNQSDGTKYINDAIEKGAAVIIRQGGKYYCEKKPNVTLISVTDVRKIMAGVAQYFFRSSFYKIAVVTGTNGKSSTVDMVRQIMNNDNFEAASIGTLGVISRRYTEKFPNHLTSPGSIALNKILQQLTGKVATVVMEASSHGIEQKRIAYIPFDVCGFTNFSEDHLDYHKTMNNYWKAKSLLFSDIAPSKAKFVINADDPKCKHIEKIAKMRNIECLTYGYKGQDFCIIDIKIDGIGQSVLFEYKPKHEYYKYYLPLAGEFQVYNSLCALGICYCCGMDIESIVEQIPKIMPIAGRLERVVPNANIYVDYAHTPDALQNAICSLKKSGNVTVVFGCGGDRDSQKREIMGHIASKYADKVIITDDNPRTENPATIRQSIMKGCPHAIEIADRREAICYAIDNMKENEFLLIAGKGHEDYQLIGDRTLYFSDREVVQEYLSGKNEN